MCVSAYTSALQISGSDLPTLMLHGSLFLLKPLAHTSSSACSSLLAILEKTFCLLDFSFLQILALFRVDIPDCSLNYVVLSATNHFPIKC